jgi:small subunit ribosomal protein S5
VSNMNRGRRGDRRRDDDNNFVEKTIFINRVAKVVKGGRRFNFAAIVVCGDGEGKVGIGQGKANEVPEAIRKATERARKTMRPVPIVDGTVPHYVHGEFGAAEVVLRPASPGTGVIAGATVRAILDAAGYHNVLTKVLGSNNPYNVVKAVMNALERLESPEQYAARVGRPVDEVLANYNVGASVWGSADAHGA